MAHRVTSYSAGTCLALIIKSDSGEVLDIFPHRLSTREVTIREVLTES
jgi:hypothetical protein